MTQTLGWVATAIFVGSYFLRPAALRAIQMVAAVLWIVYGILIDATPVIAANALVFSAAAWTLARGYFVGPEVAGVVPAPGKSRTEAGY